MFGAVISYFSGSKEFLITLTLFNRYPFHPDVEKLWGDFTSTNLFHFVLSETSQHSGSNLHQTIERTHQILWDDVNHALFPGLSVQKGA